MLFGARALQGDRSPPSWPRRPVAAHGDFHRRHSARAFGIYGAISGGGMSIGLIMGGMLTQWASWRWTLLVTCPSP